ncbi:MAG: ATP-binding protein [Mariprofundaceae bacterium]
MSINIQEGHERLKRLLGYRLLASVVILFAAAYFFYFPLSVIERQIFTGATLGFVIFIALEWQLIRSRLIFPVQLFIQFGLDLLLVAVLVLLTGGIQSPFVFLFGLIIVAAGTQSHTLVVLLLTVVACICYLVSIHGFALWYNLPIASSETPHILLQTSALFLVGGVMAAIARRHASLQQERRQAVRQHRRLKDLHEQVVGSMQEGILILDETLHIQESNEPADRLLGLDHSHSWLKLGEVATVPDILLTFLHREGKGPFQCEWKTASGVCLVTATTLPSEDPSGRWLLTMVDISDLRKLERQLAEQDKLAAMGRMVAMLAHEVRNPLQTIGQSVELIRTVSEAKQVTIQKIVTEEIGRLNRLVSDMLDYVQPLTPEPVMVSCSELIGSSVVQIDMQDEYEITWHCDMDSLVVDPDHFRLVLDNLLRNAVQASSQPNSVKIELGLADVELGGVAAEHWELSIMDQGGGISKEMKEHLFEPFATGRARGIGLGLATVWQVCQVNGWHAEVMKIPGGSRFIVRGDIVDNSNRDVTHG